MSTFLPARSACARSQPVSGFSSAVVHPTVRVHPASTPQRVRSQPGRLSLPEPSGGALMDGLALAGLFSPRRRLRVLRAASPVLFCKCPSSARFAPWEAVTAPTPRRQRSHG